MPLARRHFRGSHGAQGLYDAAQQAKRSQVTLQLSLAMFAVYVVLARMAPELRYTRYVLPLTLAGLWLARRAQGQRLPVFTPPLSAFAVMTTIVCAWSFIVIGATSDYYARFFEEAVFLFAPLGAAMICASLRREDGDWPFFVLLAILTMDYFWEIGLETMAEALRQPGAFLASLLESTAPTESIRAFSFGVLAIFLLARRRLLSAAFCLALACMAGKRIVLLGLLAAIPLVYITPALDRPRRRVALTAVAIALNVTIALALRNLEQWGIASRIQEATMQSADAVLMGRAKLYALLSDRLPDSPLLGAGLGRITHVLQSEDAWLTNTHSDVLKHFIELGPLMFALWIGCFYWTSRHRGALALTVFTNILFLSDNVSIYFDVMFPFYLAFAYLDHRQAVSRIEPVARRRPTCLEPAPARAA